MLVNLPICAVRRRVSARKRVFTQAVLVNSETHIQRLGSSGCRSVSCVISYDLNSTAAEELVDTLALEIVGRAVER